MPVRNVRRRYLAFHLNSEIEISVEKLYSMLKENISNLYGIKGLVDANLKLIEYESDSKTGILRCNHDFLRQLRTAIVFIKKIDSKPVSINITRTSGTIKSLKKKIV
jgi:RNase P/RNase MRP subunit POP5